MADRNPAGRVPKSAWWLVAIAGVLWFVIGLLILILPGDPGNRVFFTGDPSTYPTQASNDLIYAAQLVGVALMMAGLLQLGIGLTAFKKGERWAWYAISTSLIILVFSLYISVAGTRGPAMTAFVQYLPFWLPQVLALLLSMRSFFPAKPRTSSSAP